jgi:hypothetical protein
LITHVLSLTYWQAWEKGVLSFLKPYLINSLLNMTSNLLPPHHADCPSLSFEGVNDEAQEPVSIASVIYKF